MNNLICPITQLPFTDPVSTIDGQTYERSAIEEWFSRGNDTSPATGQHLSSKRLIPNLALKQLIQGDATLDTTGRMMMMVEQEEEDIPKLTVRQNSKNGTRFLATTKDKLLPVSIVLVLDVSGSMNENASTGKPGSESAKFTRLELVQHSALCIIDLLGSNDTLSIVTFSDSANTILPWTAMTGEVEMKRNQGLINQMDGKERARQCIHSITAGGGTNLWAGIECAYKMTPRPNVHTSIIVLTDGQPSTTPDRGYKEAMLSLVRPTATLHMCGFGYQLATDLLCELAEYGGGIFNFIPDGSMVGTVFIHFLANIKLTLFTAVEVCFGTEHPFLRIQLGSIRKDIPRHFLVQVVKVFSNGKEVPFTLEQAEFEPQIPVQFFTTLDDAMIVAREGDREKAYRIMVEYSKTLPPGPLRDDIFHLSSEKGQICKAFDAWKSWGYPYLSAIMFAHTREQKVNFKDESMKAYTTPAFEAFCEAGMTIFAAIPPPKGAVTRARRRGGGGGVSMRAMASVSAGCFSPGSMVLLEDGNVVAMESVKKGMRLKGGFEVECVVEYPGFTVTYMVSDALSLTQWHPYRLNSTEEWRFPLVISYRFLECDKVFNLVLKSGHYVETPSGRQAVTLGHGMNDGPVISHPYYGTRKCIDDLMKLPGYDEGRVIVNKVSRDVKSGLVCKME